ncbi:hypothetical protein V5H41_28950, partial [Salmonella enterica]
RGASGLPARQRLARRLCRNANVTPLTGKTRRAILSALRLAQETAARLASRLGSVWHAVYVETPTLHRLPEKHGGL